MVEVEGVHIHAFINAEGDGTTEAAGLAQPDSNRGGLPRGVKANQPRSTHRNKHDAGDYTSRIPFGVDPQEDAHTTLPTTEDLAQSFLDSEPLSEKEQLKAALANAQHVDQSQILDETDDESEEGLGTALSLPAFLADFLKGVANRLTLRIRTVQVEIKVLLDLPGSSVSEDVSPHPEQLALRFSVDRIDVDEIKHAEEEFTPSGPTASSSGTYTRVIGKRRITVDKIHGFLMAEASVFNFFSQFSSPPSPAATYSGGIQKGTRSTSPSATKSSTSSGVGLGMMQSTILDSRQLPDSGSESASSPIASARLSNQPYRNVRESQPPSDPEQYDSDPSNSLYEDFGGIAQSYSRSIEEHRPAEPLTDSNVFPTQAPTRGKFARGSSRDRLAKPTAGSASEVIPRNVQPAPRAAGSKRTTSRSASGNNRLPPSQLSREGSDIGPDPASSSSSPEDLTRSRIFSHEEAESMYLSAISHAGPSKSSQAIVPGGWGSLDSDGEASSDELPDFLFHSSKAPRPESTSANNPKAEPQLPRASEPMTESNYESMIISPEKDATAASAPSNIASPERKIGLEHNSPSESFLSFAHDASSEPSESATRENTSREHLSSSIEHQGSEKSSQSPLRSTSSNDIVIKRFFALDLITVEIPQEAFKKTENREESLVATTSTRSTSHDIPGAFSMHTPSLSSHEEMEDLDKKPSPASNPSSQDNLDIKSDPMSIKAGNLMITSDMGLIRLVILSTQQLSHLGTSRAPTSKIEKNHAKTSWVAHIEGFTLRFVDILRSSHDFESFSSSQSLAKSSSSEVLLELGIKNIRASYNREENLTQSELSFGKFIFGYPQNPILSFDSSLKMRESYRDNLAPIGHDITIKTKQIGQNPLEITIMTLPLHVCLDLCTLDETFSWFGGLSSVLGLGSSIMSNTTIVESKPKYVPPKKPTRIRFDEPSAQAELPDAEATKANGNKITARIGGFAFDVRGKECSLALEGSAIKIVSRFEGIGMRIDKLRFTGPHLIENPDRAAVTADISGIRLEYLPVPKEEDLARLLALLSPSRDRDEQDDDILLDTLLRQRRQGALLRLNVENVTSQITRPHDFEHFTTLSEELNKLASVTKYLPEDDRPGILTLVLVQDLKLDVEVNEKFGYVHIGAKDVELGFVTFPSLLLLAVDSLHAQHGTNELVGEALMQPPRNPGSGHHSPMIMIRVVGDEMEPTLKIKLWNLRLEYHVSTVMDILGISETATGEAIFTEMISSVATLTAHKTPPKLPSQASVESDRSADTKQMRFDVAVRDSVIGLNPRKSAAKGLLVMTRSRILGTFPKSSVSEFNLSLDIKKLSLLIIDDIANLEPADDALSQVVHFGSAGEKTHMSALCSMGFVSMSEISSASVSVKLSAVGKDGERFVDVEARDELFVLESCADSTQTLITILSGLAPPMPPSKELKYRTEVVPVQDMLASFTGDAYEADVTEEDDTDYDIGINESDMMDDDVPQNLEFIRSYYDPNPAATTEAAANSILEGDLASIPTKTATKKIGDKRFTSSFHEQYEVDSGDENLSLHEDHFGDDDGPGGTAHRWNSETNTYDLCKHFKIRGSPFNLRVRDVHVIWNLFDGYDWQHTRNVIGQAVADVETKAAERLAKRDKRQSMDIDEEDESVIGDFLFNSIYIGVGLNHDPRDLARQINRNIDDVASEAESYATTTTVSASPSRQGTPKSRRRKLRLQRSRNRKMTFELRAVSADVIVFPPSSGETQSSIDIRVQDLDIYDHIATSTWKKFATYMRDAGEREAGTSMVHIEMLNVKPVPDLAASEIILKATVLPLRLHVDQDALDFLTRFFEFKPDTALASSSPADQPFLQRVEINSIPVKLDFKPKRVDYAGLRSGHTTEFMNFFILDGADMVLRHVIIYGVSGFEKLGNTLNDIWMPDVKRNQLPGVLAGLAPVRSLVNVGSGVRDLVVVPMREYRKDGRVMRSLQKGAFAFAKTTTTELAKLGAKLAVGTQTVLQNAEGILAPHTTSSSEGAHLSESPPEERAMISPYADQPIGVVQGLRGAYRHLERDLLLARDAIVAVPGEIMESGSAGGAAKAVLRNAPTVILRPALGVTKAVGQTLMGATNALDKTERWRVADVSFFPPFLRF